MFHLSRVGTVVQLWQATGPNKDKEILLHEYSFENVGKAMAFKYGLEEGIDLAERYTTVEMLIRPLKNMTTEQMNLKGGTC